MNKGIRILILEDSAADASLMEDELQEAAIPFISKRVYKEEDFVRELQDFSPDLILSDYDLPQYNGALALAESRKRCPDTPFILVSGAVIEDLAVEMLTQGAKDYVLKTRLQQRLAPAVRRVLAEAEEHRARKLAEAELREVHRTLEERVRIRTAELEAEIATRKKTQEALQNSERRYWRLFESAEDGVLILDGEMGRVINVNPCLLRLLGSSYEEVQGKHIWEIGSFHNIAASKDAFLALQDNECFRYDDLLLETCDGRSISVEFVSTVFFVDHSKVIQCNIRDITKRKQAAAALRKSVDRHRTIIQTAMDGFWLVDMKGHLLEVNDAYCRMSGYSEQELFTMNISELEAIETFDDTSIHIQKIMEQGEDRFETRHRRKDGTIFDVEISVQSQPFDDGQLVVFLHDITNRKRHEQLILTSLSEKETLLREIHHRVKNNLQIISSILKMQVRHIDNGKLEGVFQECQDRIKAMAAVHSLLYKSQNFSEVNFGEYVREMADQLFRSYKTSTAAISLVIQAENVRLPIDIAIPCGLIINELVTNTLKYAFPGVRKGEITIEINQTGNGIRLFYEDNGIGSPEAMDLSNAETMGLKLINMLVEQLGGTIEQVITSGTGYLIRFKAHSTSEGIPHA